MKFGGIRMVFRIFPTIGRRSFFTGTARAPSRPSFGRTPLLLGAVAVLLLSGLFAFPGATSGTPALPHAAAVPGSEGVGQMHLCGSMSGACAATSTGVPGSATSVSHDALLISPDTTILSGSYGTFNASLPGGVTATQYVWTYGDGTSTTTVGAQDRHVFDTPGIYLAQVIATDTTGTTHDNLGGLYVFPVQASYANDSFGNRALISGDVLANSTSTLSATGAIHPGQFVTVGASVQSEPTTPEWNTSAPWFEPDPRAGAHETLSPVSVGSSGESTTTVSFDATTPAGLYNATVVFPVLDPTTGGIGWSNFTFAIEVASGDAAYAAPSLASPHPGLLRASWNYPGGSVSEDPAMDYETIGAEVIQNVYQTLITYNGSQASSSPSAFVPDLATCVPGTAQCQALYGSPLVTSSGDYTFVLNPNDRFYDPATGAGWEVHPFDVVYSVARACVLAEPLFAATPGWVLCQALLPVGSSTYDGAFHYPQNNTPFRILSSMTINETGACPTVGGSFAGSGCVTFHTSLSGAVWPEFLALLADPLGASVVSCAWAALHGVALAPWGNTPASCSSVPTPTSLPDTAWDSYENLQLTNSYYSYLQWHMVGSGPYMVQNLTPYQNYSLAANPDWGATTCQGGRAMGCLPWPGSYIPRVEVNWTYSQVPGEDQYWNRSVDIATIPGADETLLLDMLQKGIVSLAQVPTLDTYFQPFDMAFAQGVAQTYTTSNISIPSWALQDMNLRQFIVHSYPYASALSQTCTVAGIRYCVGYGGAIPLYMSGYTPTNISWPNSNPDVDPANVGGAAWWWTQAKSDSLFGTLPCLAAPPCRIPVFFSGGDTYDMGMLAETNWWVNDISGGEVQLFAINVTFSQLVNNMFASPGSNAFPMFEAGWMPDYADPSDYAVPILYPDSTYTSSSAVLEGLTGSLAHANYMASCPGTLYTYSAVTNSCQGAAYENMVTLLAQAGTCAPPACSLSNRALWYNMAEQIDNQLALDSWNFQSISATSYASWLDPSSIVRNPVVPGELWWQFEYRNASGSGPLAVHGPAASPSTLDLGQSLTMSLSISGGHPAYVMAWSGLPTGCTNASVTSITCTPTATGIFHVNATVRDAVGDVVSVGPASIFVDPAPVISSFTAAPNPVNQGSATTLSVTASGGTPPLTYSYTGLPGGCSSSNVATLVCTPSVSGTFTVTAAVTDAAADSVTRTLSLTVSSVGLSLSSVTLSPPNAGLAPGTAKSFQAFGTSSTGATVYGVSYVWQISPSSLGTLNASLGNVVTLTAGSVLESGTLWVNGTYGLSSAGAVADIAVSPGGIVLGSVLVTPVTVAVPSGTVSSFTASAYASSGSELWGLSYSWTLVPSSLGTLNATTGPVVQLSSGTHAGSGSLWVNATFGSTHGAEALVTNLGPPALQATLSTDPAWTSLVGGSVTVTTVATGGWGPYSYLYFSLPPGCTSSNSSTITCTPSAAGKYDLTVTVTDHAGQSAVASVPLTVVAASSQGANAQDALILWILLLIALIAVAGVAIALGLRRHGDAAGAGQEPPPLRPFESPSSAPSAEPPRAEAAAPPPPETPAPPPPPPEPASDKETAEATGAAGAVTPSDASAPEAATPEGSAPEATPESDGSSPGGESPEGSAHEVPPEGEGPGASPPAAEGDAPPSP